MRWNSVWNPVSLPTKDTLLRWLLWRSVAAMGCGAWIGFAALLLIVLVFAGFLIGDYTGSGNPQSVQNLAVAKRAEIAASQWQTGLTEAQVATVQAEQVDLPSAVLLAVGKMIDNLHPLQASRYYSELAPSYTWETFTDVTTTEHPVWKTKTTLDPKTHKKRVQHVRVCETSVVQTPVTELVSATTWDGVLTNTFGYQTTGNLTGCSGVQKRVVVQTGGVRTYTWSRVWNLFAQIPAVLPGGKKEWIRRTKTNEQILAGLIAAQNVAISDPYVQQMADTVLTLGVTGPMPTLGSVGVASGSVVQNVLRYRSLITYFSTRYGVPAALVAGVMAQESGGREHGPGGVVLSSGVGSGGIGALGLMQVEPSTASGMYVNGEYVGPSAISDLSNPATNIQIGSKYIAELYHEFGGNAEETLSAYNAGPGAELQALASGQTVAQNPQTIQYVSNIIDYWMPAFTPT